MTPKRLAIFKPTTPANIAEDYVAFMHESLLEYVDIILTADELPGTNESLSTYDEIILFDDSVFGPLHPLAAVFNQMAGRDCDIWSISTSDYYFIGLRPSVFMQDGFREILARYPNDGFTEALAHLIKAKNYQLSTYADTTALDTDYDKHDHYLVSPHTLIKDFQIPFLKKEIFSQNLNLSVSMREETRAAFAFIEHSPDYDMDLIWRHIIKTCNMVDIKRNLSLNYILPAKVKIADYHNGGERVAIIVHLAYPALMEDCFSYLTRVPEYCDIFVTTYDPGMRHQIDERLAMFTRHETKKSILVTNRGRDVSALLVGCKEIIGNYDIICFTHDKKTAGGRGPMAVGRSYFYNIWENTLKSREYINNILWTMQENPRLGLLSPPQPLHYGYINIRGKEWTNCYQGLNEWAQKLGLKCDIDPDKHPFSLSTAFWCRTKAIKKLLDYPFAYEDFPPEPMATDGELGHYLERLFMFVAQDAGYYTAMASNNEYAALDLENASHVIGEMNSLIRRGGLQWVKSREEIIAFIRQNSTKNVYIYGAGVIGKSLANILQKSNIDITGHIISDDQTIPVTQDGYPIYHASDCDLNTAALIVALDYQHTEEVKPYLREKGARSVFYLNEIDIMSDGSWLYG